MEIKDKYWNSRALTLQEKIVMNELTNHSEQEQEDWFKYPNKETGILDTLGVCDVTFGRMLGALKAKKFIDKRLIKGNQRYIKILK